MRNDSENGREKKSLSVQQNKKSVKVVVCGPMVEVYITDAFDRQAKSGQGVRLNEFKRADNALRAKRMLRWLSASNAVPGRAYFFTATFADDVQDYDEGLKRWKRFRKMLLYEYPDCVYIAVPEIQKRSGRWHFHAIFCNMPTIKEMKKKYGKMRTSNGKYCDAWQYHFTQRWSKANGGRKTHRANIEVAKSLGGVCQYLSKYLAKDIGGTVPIGRRNYYSGGRCLRRPEVSDDPSKIPEYDSLSFQTQYKDALGRHVEFYRYVIE